MAYDISYEELQEVEYDVIIYFDPHWEKIYYKDEKKLYRKKPVEINLLTERTFEEKILNWKSLYENKIIKNYLVPKIKRQEENLDLQKRILWNFFTYNKKLKQNQGGREWSVILITEL